MAPGIALHYGQDPGMGPSNCHGFFLKELPKMGIIRLEMVRMTSFGPHDEMSLYAVIFLSRAHCMLLTHWRAHHRSVKARAC